MDTCPNLAVLSTKKAYCVKRIQAEYIYFLSFSLPASDYVEYIYIHMRTYTTPHLTKSCT